MADKHTPGPWIFAEAVEGRYTKTDMRRIRSASEGFEHGAVCEVYGINDGTEACANARLIAAVPELLEALRITRGKIASLSPAGTLDPFEPYREWLAMLDRTIAKATGEQL